MLEIVWKREMLQSPTTTITASTTIGLMIEAEEMSLMIVKKAIILKRDQETQGMEKMQLLLNLNIFLFLLFLFPLLRIRVIVGW